MSHLGFFAIHPLKLNAEVNSVAENAILYGIIWITTENYELFRYFVPATQHACPPGWLLALLSVAFSARILAVVPSGSFFPKLNWFVNLHNLQFTVAVSR